MSRETGLLGNVEIYNFWFSDHLVSSTLNLGMFLLQRMIFSYFVNSTQSYLSYLVTWKFIFTYISILGVKTCMVSLNFFLSLYSWFSDMKKDAIYHFFTIESRLCFNAKTNSVKSNIKVDWKLCTLSENWILSSSYFSWFHGCFKALEFIKMLLCLTKLFIKMNIFMGLFNKYLHKLKTNLWLTIFNIWNDARPSKKRYSYLHRLHNLCSFLCWFSTFTVSKRCFILIT